MFSPSIACWNVRGLMVDGRLRDCNRIIWENKLDLLCLLETKLNFVSLASNRFHTISTLFSSQHLHQNFDTHSGGRILIVWNSFVINFVPIITAPQLVHGYITFTNGKSSAIFCIYAHNSTLDRRAL